MKYILLSLPFLFLTSCSNNKKDKIEPTVPPVVGTVSYVNDVQPIINNYCISCHPANNPGTKLGTYDQVKAKADDGSLVGSITANGYALMPSGGPPLSNAQIQNITNWVNQGAPNN
jgi:mono/diheme cytochrome c family protein